MSGVRAQTWAFRGFLVILNVGGLVWIHHKMTWTPQPRLRVLSALPARDVDAADRFSLVFDEPLHLVGAVESALADAPFMVEPAVPGEWVWAAPDRVEYRLAQPLRPGKRFKLRPSPNLERLTGRTLVGTTEFTFETRPLRLLHCRPASSDRTNVNVELCFNQPVTPGELLRHLKVTGTSGRRRKLQTECLTQAPADRLTVRTARPAGDDLKIELDGKLAGEGGDLPLGENAIHTLTIAPVFGLTRAEVESPGLNTNTVVRLEFTNELKTGQPVPSVRVTPEVQGLSVTMQDNGVVLCGSFEAGRRYSATVGGSVRSSDDKPLGEDATVSFGIADREPSVSIPLSNGILSPGGNLMLDLKAVNVAGLNLKAGRVHENNLVAHLHRSDRWMTARELPEKKIKLNLERNQIGKLALDLREIVGERRGIYLIQAEASDVTWTSDHAVVAITDLAITSKNERDGLFVWVTSLRSARPVAGAEVTAISFNGQPVGTGTTDTFGVARVAISTGHPDGQPWVVTARQGDDVSFLKLGERSLITEGVDYSGREIPKTYDVMVYPERGVYRPGDTIHLTGIVRDSDGPVPPAFPLAVRVHRPDGREVASLPVQPSPSLQGLFHADYVTREDGQTGQYRFTVGLPGDREPLGSAEALVEEFVPVRMEVKVEWAGENADGATVPRAGIAEAAVPQETVDGKPAAPRLFVPGESVTAGVKARYLFGQPVTDVAVTFNGRLQRLDFQSKRHEGFTFSDPKAAKTHELEEMEDVLDEDGTATMELLDPVKVPAGLWHGKWTATVTEEGGRSVSAHAECRVDTAGRHLGLRLPGGRLVQVGMPVAVEWVQVTAQDEPAKVETMAFKMERVEEDLTLQDVDGRLIWKTLERVTTIQEGEIGGLLLTGPQGRIEILCPTAGEYRLRVEGCDSRVTAQVVLHASDEAEAACMLATGRPERLELVLDHEKYSPGSTAKLLVRSPFPGTLLLAVESDQILESRVMGVTGESVEVELPVGEGLRGGAFVSATLVRAVDPTRDRWLPHRAFGMARLVTDHRRRALPVTLTAPSRAKPGESVSVKVQTPSPRDPKAPPVVHLWAVDEGILMTTAYETPQPSDHFFAHRKASVTMTDVFDELLPDYTRPASTARIGGDGDKEKCEDREAMRRSPVRSPRRIPAVVWAAAVPVGADGTVMAAMKMPELNGEMRLMVIAVEGDTYGTADYAMTLASPLLIEMSAPRFAAPQDRFEIPAKVFNGTDKTVRATMEVQPSGPVKVEIKDSLREVEVKPGEPVTVWLEVKPTGGLGEAKIIMKATQAEDGLGEPMTATADAVFPVRPTGPLHCETKMLRIKAGELWRMESPSAVSTRPAENGQDAGPAFLPGTAKHGVSISGRPSVELRPVLEDLLEYPYGCVEQTTSRLWALLYAPDLLASQESGAARAKVAAEMIEAGLARLWSMQTSSGGLAYWPGDSSPNLWGSAYAAEFIAQASRVGYRVDSRFVEDLSKYLLAALSRGGDEEVDDDVRAQLCCVLSMMGKPPLGWMSRLSERVGGLDVAGRAHLAGAWGAAGRKDRAAAALPEDTLAGRIATTTGGRLTSQVRSEAVLLNVLLDLDQRHPWIPMLVGRLEKARKAGRWGSTLENASALAAMARYQTAAPAETRFEGVVAVGDYRRAFDHTVAAVFEIADEGRPIEIRSTGQGDVYVCVTTEGLLRDAPPQDYDHRLQVSRKWTDRSGQTVDPSKLAVGDLVLVETTLTGAGLENGEIAENVAIVDALPAGLEVENPRLVTSETDDGRKSDKPDRIEFRDDRVLVFTSAGQTTRTFRYALRVVTIGTFEWPAIQASCMYDAGLASMHGGGAKVAVEGRHSAR